MARIDRSSMTAGVASSGAPAPRSAPTVAVQAGAPPPSVESVQGVLAR
jgi:hypothetical protein